MRTALFALGRMALSVALFAIKRPAAKIFPSLSANSTNTK